ncbi:MAG: FAD:protein FMN transferase, partial [Myxococcota bacterium]
PERPGSAVPAPPPLSFETLGGRAFGTTFTLRWKPREGLAPGAVEEAMVSVVKAVNASMSTYHPTSELSRFNGAEAGSTTVSASLAEVLAAAWRMHELTGGAFDPTVGPLVEAWGFGPKEVVDPPLPAELAAARDLVGLSAVGLDEDSRTLSKPLEGISIELSAIAKGYAVDQVSEALLELGVQDHLVEIGGEVRGSGRGPRGRWTVGIERPEPGSTKRVEEVVPLPAGRGLATSGNYRNFVLGEGGRTVTHIIDPRSGNPVDHGLGSVTVVADTCMTADALATALYVLCEENGYAWAEERGIAALFLTLDAGSVHRKATSAYASIEESRP